MQAKLLSMSIRRGREGYFRSSKWCHCCLFQCKNTFQSSVNRRILMKNIFGRYSLSLAASCCAIGHWLALSCWLMKSTKVQTPRSIVCRDGGRVGGTQAV